MSGRGYMPPASKTDWQTPPALFDALAEKCGPFDLDPCCLPWHRTAGLVPFICTPPDLPYYRMPYWAARDGLAQEWEGRVFVNPPHDNLFPWIKKCSQSVRIGSATLVAALLPVRSDTRWWQAYVCTSTVWHWANEVRFLPGRLKFVGASSSAPFPSAVVVWRKP